MGIKNERRLGVFFHPIQKKTAESSFSCAYLSGDYNDTLALGYAVTKMREGLFMFFAGEKESRVRGYVKRPFVQSIKLTVHK